MRKKLYNGLHLFSLFGIALYFFGILYEGVVYGPKLLDVSRERMLFWKDFMSVISPIIYYVPLVYLATIVLVVLNFRPPIEQRVIKKRLKLATVFQITSLALTIYILAAINFKMRFGNLSEYGDTIPGKVILFNILSVCRVCFIAIALIAIFKAYIGVQHENAR